MRLNRPHLLDNALQHNRPACACSRFTTGLKYEPKGLASAPNVTRRNYGVGRTRKGVLANLGADATLQELAQAACGTDDIADQECVDVLLLTLTPAAYSSNSTADTPGRRAFVSPAQVGDTAMLKESSGLRFGGKRSSQSSSCLLATALLQQPLYAQRQQ
jgi:hypothetical protein